MGKRKKGFNWKARDQASSDADRSTENLQKEQVEINLEGVKVDQGYDGSNIMALPGKKQETKKNEIQVKKVKKLTKKERKKFERIIEQKEKKEKRASVLESLMSHQVKPEVMNQFMSISEMQTGKLKRKIDIIQDNDITVNTIAGSNKKWKKQVSESESDSEESIQTSDMSSDEEFLGDITQNGSDKKNCASSEAVHCEERTEVLNNENNSAINESSEVDETDSKENEIDMIETRIKNASGTWIVTPTRNKHKKKKDILYTPNAAHARTKMETSENDRNKQETDNRDLIANNRNTSEIGGKDKLKSVNQENVKAPITLRKVVNIPVARDKGIQDGRLKLPILGEEQIVMESINENPVVIICGETGSGKTTQVPQFLYEAGYAHGGGIIGVTEPRRVAAISMSARVATEMSLTSREVSYQIRYEGNVTPDTKIKFMTDGVLLKEVQQDFLLSKYSVIIIDEAHERSMYTDILIGLLSRIVPLRHKKGNPLKLVIMSATLRVEDFTDNKRLFRVTPPVIKVDARQFPVTIHYNKRTPLDSYLNEAYRKMCKIHKQLPEGGILVFVTGQQEVHTLCKKLKQTFPMDGKTGNHMSQKRQRPRKTSQSSKDVPELPKISLDNYSVSPHDEEAEMEAGESDIDLGDEDDLGNYDNNEEEDDLDVDKDGMKLAAGGCTQPLYVLPLYSLLSTEKQAQVFQPPPEGCRLCVVATNVAETSLTIPNVKYVVDTGKMKTKFFDKVTGVSTFKITWTSKAGANQRAGRAGRVGPGHCYRLYSSAVFNDEFEMFSAAEITRRPVDDLVLQMKDMNIEKVVNFPYPTPPDMEQIQAAENLLISLGAVSAPQAPRSYRESRKVQQTTITPLGRAMSCFPVSPRYAKMLSLGHQHSLLPYVVVMVSALSVQELFTEVYSDTQDETQIAKTKQKLMHITEVKRRWAGSGHSLLLGDLMVMLKAVGSCEYEGCTPQFCDNHGIRIKAMKEVRKLRMQLTNSVNTVIPEANICVDPKMSPPDDIQAKLLRQIVLAGMGDHVARKLPDLPSTDPNAKKMKHAYQCPELEDPVFIHPTSVLYRQRPEYVVYQYIQETSKLYMKGIVAVEPQWLSVFAASHVSLSKPLEDPPPEFDQTKGQVTCHMTGTFGNCAWQLPAVSLEYPTGIDKIKWFAKFFLEGKVIDSIQTFTPDLLSSPATMVKTWAKLQPRTEALLKVLVSERVDSKDSLLRVWKKQPDYLLSAMKEWIPQSRHGELTSLWPPV